MEIKLIIEGMHCDACQTLIGMEIEENGFEDKVSSLKILAGENKGVLQLKNVTEEDVSTVKRLINAMEPYKVE